MVIYFGFPVWGAGHIDLFTGVCLPSLLAPGNIPALRDAGRCRFFIYTRAEDAHRLKTAPMIAVLRRYMPVEIRLLREPIGNPYHSASEGYAAVLRLAALDEVAAVLPAPDHIFADGSIAALERIAEDGADVVHVAGPRIRLDSLLAWIDTAPLSLSPRALVSFGLSSLHPAALPHVWESQDEEDTGLNPSVLFFPFEGGLVARCFHMHPMLIRPRVKFPEVRGTVDDHFAAAACPDLSRHRVVTDSDEVCVFEISAPEKTIPAPCVKGDIAGASRWVRENAASPMCRRLIRHKVVLHGGDIARAIPSRELEHVARQSDTVVGAILRGA